MKTAAALTLCLLLPALPGPAQAADTDYGLKLKTVGFGEGQRDLGATGAQKTEESYLDVQPSLLVHWTPEVSSYLHLQGFLSSGDVVLNEDERPVRSDRFAGLREAWFEFGGLSDYPGEVLRAGLQRVRDADGLWWDRDIESLRWVFDTTLKQSHFGITEQFHTYRTDDVELSPSQRDRAYAFGGSARQWRPGHFTGFRLTYAQDHGDPPAPGSTVTASSKLKERRFLWLGLRAENGYYDYRLSQPVAYWMEAVLLLGDQNVTQTTPTDPMDPASPQVVAGSGESSNKLIAGAGDAGLRFRPPLIFPLHLGAAFAFAQGGDDTFVQTGLQSNRSRFTGTRSLINRFSESLQANLTNLSSAAVFAALPLESGDASLIFHKFQRNDGSIGVSTDGVDLAPVNGSHDLGSAVDLVLTRYFGEVEISGGERSRDEDLRSNLRLRASQFEPGAAYGDGAEKQYRVLLEGTLLW